MAVEGETEAVTVQPAVEEPEKAEEEEEEEKPKTAPKEKKPKAAPKEKQPKAAPKEKNPKAATKEKKPKTLSHPPYFEMITDALQASNENSGSSPYAIAKHMEEKHKAELPGNFRKILAVQLKNFAAKGKLIKIRASYKLSESGKNDMPKTTTIVKRTRSATAAAKIKAEAPKPTKKTVSVPVTVKGKRTPGKPRLPKSIKSPAVKKVMKISA